MFQIHVYVDYLLNNDLNGLWCISHYVRFTTIHRTKLKCQYCFQCWLCCRSLRCFSITSTLFFNIIITFINHPCNNINYLLNASSEPSMFLSILSCDIFEVKSFHWTNKKIKIKTTTILCLFRAILPFIASKS
jgi:hypothetical protein